MSIIKTKFIITIYNIILQNLLIIFLVYKDKHYIKNENDKLKISQD